MMTIMTILTIVVSEDTLQGFDKNKYIKMMGKRALLYFKLNKLYRTACAPSTYYLLLRVS